MLVGWDGCEVCDPCNRVARLCGPCARVCPRCFPCVSRLPPVSFYWFSGARCEGVTELKFVHIASYTRELANNAILMRP